MARRNRRSVRMNKVVRRRILGHSLKRGGERK